MFFLAFGWNLLIVFGLGTPDFVKARIATPGAVPSSKYSTTLCETSSEFYGVCQMNNMECTNGTYTDGLCRRPINHGQIPSNGGAIHVSCCIEGDFTGYGPGIGYQSSTTTKTPGKSTSYQPTTTTPVQSTKPNCGYITEVYTALLIPDAIESSPSIESCWVSCCVNQSCSAISYDNSTSMCTLSGEPNVVYYREDDDGEQLILVKESFSADLKVYNFSTLLARGADVTLSSLYEARHGYLAVDGIYNTNQSECCSMAHTRTEPSPWLQVNLPVNHHIFGVKIWDRSFGSPSSNDRLANVRVTIGESDASFDNPPEEKICNYLPGQPPADIFLVTCRTRMYGRHVRLTAVEVNGILNIYEIEVHGLVYMSP